jgi:hypothetical protein
VLAADDYVGLACRSFNLTVRQQMTPRDQRWDLMERRAAIFSTDHLAGDDLDTLRRLNWALGNESPYWARVEPSGGADEAFKHLDDAIAQVKDRCEHQDCPDMACTQCPVSDEALTEAERVVRDGRIAALRAVRKTEPAPVPGDYLDLDPADQELWLARVQEAICDLADYCPEALTASRVGLRVRDEGVAHENGRDQRLYAVYS